jgi:hypothetical protein
MFGGELQFLARLLIYLVIGIATIVSAKNVMSGLGMTMATIGEGRATKGAYVAGNTSYEPRTTTAATAGTASHPDSPRGH